MATVISRQSWHSDDRTERVIEQRSVLVEVSPGFYTDPYRRAFTFDEVQHTIDEWGRAPIDLERTRAMLVDLAKVLHPRESADIRTAEDMARHLAAGRVLTVETSACRFDACVTRCDVIPGTDLHGVEVVLRSIGAPR